MSQLPDERAKPRAVFYQKRITTSRIPAASRCEFKVKRYSRRAKGGAYEAVIEATGSDDDLAELLNWCRYQVDIYNWAGTWVWGGYVREVTVRLGKVEWTVSLDETANRVAVAYTLTTEGESSVGSRATTAWTEDSTSIKEYGRKEQLVSQGGVSEAYALAKRDRELERRRYPIGRPTINVVSANQAAKKATITCEGWWHTLDWMYANVPTKLVLSFETIGTVERTVGCDYDDDADNVIRLAQDFETSATEWNVLQVGLYVKRVGTPEGTLSVSICDVDGDGYPNTSLASGSLGAGSISTSYGWVLATLSAAVELAASSHYTLQISFSGTVNQDNYYVFMIDDGMGFVGGELIEYVSAWTNVDASLPFRLRTDELVASDIQIQSLVNGFGQFFERVSVQDASGITLESFRPGDNDVKYEVEDLLETGISSGARLLADVDEGRNVRVFAAADEDDVDMYLREDGVFYQHNAAPVDPSTCPVGFWAEETAIIPASVDTSRIGGLGVFFVEQSEYDVERDQMYFEALGADDAFRFGTKEG